MSIPQWRAERADRERITAGLPSLRCPNCDRIGPHWEPERIDTPGRWICNLTSNPTPK